MNKFTPTDAQAAAIQTRGSAVLVSAGAGSGKTKVLTERLMGYICDGERPVDLDSFLIITFTKAAAGELRGRIMEELSAAQAMDPNNRRLRRQSALCARTMIGTIHGFCSALLRENSQAAGLTPDFAVADEGRAEAMKSAALERTLERFYEKAAPGFLLLADTVGAGRDDRRLRELALKLHENMQCHARPEQWAEEQKKQLRARYGGIGDSPWGREFLCQAQETVSYWCGELDLLLTEAQTDAALKRRYLPGLSAGAEGLRELNRCLDLGWEQARACPAVKFGRTLPSKKDETADIFLEERLKLRRDDCKDDIKKLRAVLDADPEKLLEDIEAMAPALEALLDLVLDFDREYAADKRRLGLVDYADLEHKAAEILIDKDGQPTELALRISRRYTEIMVDEYQDVSQVQDAIFRAISDGERKLFMVGDVKQSIYRFRLADPRIFTGKYKDYKDAADAGPGEARKIMLRENFRSRREILDAANCVFSLCMSESLGDIDYDEAAALKCAAPYEGSVPLPELLLLPVPRDQEESPNRTAREAAFVAEKIRSLIEAGETVNDRGQTRPMNYGDVAILLRAANADGAVYRRELDRLGVPVASGQTGGFFSSAEVSTAVALLELIDNPRQDIPLIAALRSPALGFSADALAAIRAADKDGDFYGALEKRAKEEGRCADFLESLEKLRQIAPDLSASELTWRVLERFDLLAVFSAMADGEQRRARLLALAELAEGFESSGYRGLHRFLLWLRQKQERNREPALGGGSGPAVQIMSVHKSKGLEFPVVFLCGMGKQFNQSDTRAAVLIHPELGLGAKRTDTENRVEYPTLAREVIKGRMERETLSEELRLLYVAMTRPKERLYITAGLEDPEETLRKAQMQASRPLPALTLTAMRTPVQWLIQAALADGGEHLRMCIAGSIQKTEMAVREEGLAVQADEDALRQLRRCLRFEYSHSQAQELPSKVTATELKGRAEPDEDAQRLEPRLKTGKTFRLPNFAKLDRPLSGAERGIATHLVLQYMDFAKTCDEDAVLEEIERLRRGRFLSEREARAVDAQAIVKLFASPLGQRMLHADRTRREFKFSLLSDAGELFGKAQGDWVLLQGVVDCFIEEQGALTVIDYKTDAVTDEAAALKRAEHYARQLQTYAYALQRICKKPVKECVLYFLRLGLAIPVKI